MARGLPRLLQLPSVRHLLYPGAVMLWAAVAGPFAVFIFLNSERWWAVLAVAAVPAAVLLRRWPMLGASALVLGATLLRLALVGSAESDPIQMAQLAGQAALNGDNPYEFSFITRYSYGPLGLLTYQAGIPGELIATVGTSAVLIWARAWTALAFYNAWPQFLQASAIGNSDFSIGFVLLASLVLIRTRPRAGAVLLAAAIAIKPYAAAWALPVAGYVGLGGSVIAGVVSVVLWSPVLLLWGLPSYLDATRSVDALRPWQAQHWPSWSFGDVPVLRLLVVPFSLAGLVLRTWRAALLLGVAGFVAFLGFSAWAHPAYLAVVVPVLGLALESRWPRRTASGEDGGANAPAVGTGRDREGASVSDVLPAGGVVTVSAARITVEIQGVGSV